MWGHHYSGKKHGTRDADALSVTYGDIVTAIWPELRRRDASLARERGERGGHASSPRRHRHPDSIAPHLKSQGKHVSRHKFSGINKSKLTLKGLD